MPDTHTAPATGHVQQVFDLAGHPVQVERDIDGAYCRLRFADTSVCLSLLEVKHLAYALTADLDRWRNTIDTATAY